VISLVNKLIGGIYIVMVDTVCKRYHRSLWEAPPETPGYHRYKSFSKQLFQGRFLLWVVYPRKLLGIPTFLKAIENQRPLIFKLIFVVFDIFLQYLILQFIDLVLCPQHGYVTEINDFHVGKPERFLALEKLMQNKGRQHKVLRVIVLLEDFWML